MHCTVVKHRHGKHIIAQNTLFPFITDHGVFAFSTFLLCVHHKNTDMTITHPQSTTVYTAEGNVPWNKV